MDISRLIEWAQRMYPHPEGTRIPNPRDQERGPVQAAAQVARAYEYHQSGRLQEAGIRDFGYGLTTLATTLMEQGRPDAAAATFQVALQTFAPLLQGGSSVDRVMERCRRSLKQLGVAESNELPPSFGEPVLRLAGLLKGVAPTVPDQLLTDAGRSPVEPVDPLVLHDSLNAYFERLTERSHLAQRAFGKIWSEDLAEARDKLPSHLPSAHPALVAHAQDLRKTTSEHVKERRIASLRAALVNHHLWQKAEDGLRSNEPQLRVDLIRYVGAVLAEGLRKSSRDLILGSVEAQVSVAYGTPPVLLRKVGLLNALLGSVGTYLLLAGPSPARAHEIEYDERIFDYLETSGSEEDDRSDMFGRRPSGRVRRPSWPVHLLKQWRSGQEVKEASFALASVAGWDRMRARWLLEQIFTASPDAASQHDLRAWQDAVDALLAAVSKVRVVHNPWVPEGTDHTQSSVITSDRAGRLWIPDPVLKAAVAQGLERGDVIKVRGEHFAGRRMPTYLLTNKFGPVSILKIDHADRVAREVENFRRYAEKRLHQRYRPSQCEAHEMEMYLGEDGEPLRAIVTSYAFEEGEEPLTLGAWFRGARAEVAADAIRRLLLTTMRPWIADVRRDRVDLRAEYPVFRSAAAPDKQSPDSWAGSELAALTDSLTSEDLGLTLPGRDERSADSLLGECLGLEEAALQLGGLELINPLWFAARVAELDDATSSSTLDGLVDPRYIDLRDYETLLVLSHGDLHMDNVLCTSTGPRLPQTVLIDFESAHYGHVCKDLARLEACALSHVFTWNPEQAGRIAAYVTNGTELIPPPLEEVLADLSNEEHLVLSTVRRIREVAFGCGQGHWPIPMHEYQLALAGSLIPMIRSTSMETGQRQFALTLSSVVCSALLGHWQRAGTSAGGC
ncbi:phosphotransferase [Streptomyces sp. NPDC056308]|uniref:phosphotransferase n=1 Tax=Streptomyces sp. NPDC056308 TaxID=3345780 RepID=UPI0035DCCE73